MQKVNASPSFTASGALGLNNAVYYGYTVTVVTATAAIFIRNGGASGQIIDVIPVATAAGATKSLSNGLATSSLYVDFNGGTGTLVLHYL